MGPFKREFEYFLILCRTLNISQAAEEAGIQQAGLSKSLKLMESYFEKPLFYRTHRGLKMTPFGEIVKANLLKANELWDQSLGKDLTTLEEVVGTLRIGSHTTIALNSFRQFFPELCETHDGLNLEIVLKKSPEITKDVVDFQLDIGIVANPVQHPDLVIVPLTKEFIAFWGMQNTKHKKVLYYNPGDDSNCSHLEKIQVL